MHASTQNAVSVTKNHYLSSTILQSAVITALRVRVRPRTPLPRALVPPSRPLRPLAGERQAPLDPVEKGCARDSRHPSTALTVTEDRCLGEGATACMPVPILADLAPVPDVSGTGAARLVEIKQGWGPTFADG